MTGTEIIVCGFYQISIEDLDPGSNTINFNSNGGDDLIVAKYNTCIDNGSSITITSCDYYLWPTNGTTYTAIGTYTETLTNISGCDSVVTLNLTINSSYNQSENITICNNENYTLPNSTVVNSNGTYYSNLTSINGCDSIIETVLNVIAPNITTSLSGITITANAFTPNYQWFDCNNAFQIIAGETSASFTPSVNGSYAVIVEENGCVDTSDCVVIDFIGYDKYDNLSVLVYPNPASNKIQIKSQNLPIHFIEFYDATGKKVFMTTQIDDIIFDLPAGIYQIHIYTTTGEKIMTNLAIVN